MLPQDPAQQEAEDDLQMALGFPYACHFVNHVNSRGMWFGDNPLLFSLPLLMMQLSFITIITRSIHLLLKPFGQPSIVSQIVVKFFFFFFSPFSPHIYCFNSLIKSNHLNSIWNKKIKKIN